MENRNLLSNEDTAQQLSLEQFAIENQKMVAQKLPVLPLESFQSSTRKLDFKESTSSLYFSHQFEEEEKKQKRFFAFSFAFHAIAAVGISFLTIPLIEKNLNEIITIEIESPQVVVPPPPIQRGSMAGGPVAPAPVKVEKAEILPAVPKAQAAPTPAPAPVKAPTAKAVARTAAPAPQVAPQTSVDKTQVFAAPEIPDAIPMSASIEDINAQDLDDNALKNSGVGEFDSNELANDFAAVDRTEQKIAASESAKLNSITDKLSEESENEIANLKAAQDAENKRITALNESRRKGELAAIAGNSGKGNDHTTVEKEGANVGEAEGEQNGQLGGKPGGISNQVRKLEDLKQMPGNPRPEYSEVERLRGDQGQAVFVAYITAQGIPMQFKIMKSTGFRNLDAKTLAALKRWKFYPGQEGWVEMPFRWDLSGEIKQKNTLLRRNGR